ncbi:hypothetical protein [Sphingopyxis panaciterrulae]|uniref:Secreted protein n=1 Tax=Sphingopyxis panaciterrulae TaxID=462372 RepID=A0A7W9B7S0_9SPHN|nr:hypothetical protein [Sphingopyxis panaciterrulae]MBB5707778.1 hypothetical protein [Sphingopyxis panaciterrulae]
MRKWTSLTTAAAVILTSVGLSATPAEARGRHHGGWGHRHHDGIDAGDVIGGLFVIGAIAAIAGAASKNRRDGDYRYEPPYPDEPRDDGYYVDPPRDARPYDGAYGGGETEQRAADACSWAAEGELGDGARVESITGTRPDQGYGWYVAGTVARPGEPLRSFGCTYRNGRATDVRFN